MEKMNLFPDTKITKDFMATIDGCIFNADFNSQTSKEDCLKEIKEKTGKSYNWFQESSGNKNWVLYSEDEYRIVKNEFGYYLHVRKGFKGKIHVPFNASSCHGYFSHTKVEDLDFSEFDTGNIVDMSGMFYMANLGNRFFPEFNTKKVVTMYMMFAGSNVKHLDLSMFDVSSVISFEGTFYGCKMLEDLNLHGWNTHNAICFGHMFTYCTGFEYLDLANLDTSSAILMNEIFMGCNHLQVLNLAGWDFSKVTTLEGAFEGCKALIDLKVEFNCTKLNSISDIFADCSKLQKVDLTGLLTQYCQIFDGVFCNCISLQEIVFPKDCSSVFKSAKYAFAKCVSLTKLNFEGVSLAQLEYAKCMFYDCNKLKEIVTKDAPSCLKQTNAEKAFLGCSSLENFSKENTGAGGFKDGGYLTIFNN